MPLSIAPASEPFSPAVIAICQRVVPGPLPVMVPVQLREHSLPDCCHTNAPRMARDHGGSAQRGWSVWTIDRLAVWLELHSVWRTAEKQLLDTTPPGPADVQRIAFLPDFSMEHTDPTDPSHHHPWDEDPLCLEFVDLMRSVDRLYFHPDDPFRRKHQVRKDQLAPLLARMDQISHLRQN